MHTSRHYDQTVEKMVTTALRAIAVDEAKRNKSKTTRKVPGFRFPRHNKVQRFTMD